MMVLPKNYRILKVRHPSILESHMSARSFTNFIHAEPALKPLLQQLSELNYLQRLYETSLPAAFATLGQVGSFRNGILIVVAHNGAAAAKLKQVVPDLEQKISQLLRQPIEVKVNVLIDSSEQRIGAPQKRKPSMGPVALESLQRLAAELPASALKDEVSTLLKRQGRRAK